MKIGDNMPSFTLTDQFGKDWNNAELTGCRTVIYAYPKDSTPGCTAEACDTVFRQLPGGQTTSYVVHAGTYKTRGQIP